MRRENYTPWTDVMDWPVADMIGDGLRQWQSKMRSQGVINCGQIHFIIIIFLLLLLFLSLPPPNPKDSLLPRYKSGKFGYSGRKSTEKLSIIAIGLHSVSMLSRVHVLRSPSQAPPMQKNKLFLILQAAMCPFHSRVVGGS